MRHVRTLITAGLTFIAILAVAAPATAQEEDPVLLINETSEQPCEVTNCSVTVEGSFGFRDGAMNSIISCHMSLTLGFNADGSATASGVSFEAAAGCLMVNCAVPGEGNWQVSEFHEIAADEYGSEVRFCLRRADGSQGHCNLALHIEEDPLDPHHYILMTAGSHHGSEFTEFFCSPAGPFVVIPSMEIDSGLIEILH